MKKQLYIDRLCGSPVKGKGCPTAVALMYGCPDGSSSFRVSEDPMTIAARIDKEHPSTQRRLRRELAMHGGAKGWHFGGETP